MYAGVPNTVCVPGLRIVSETDCVWLNASMTSYEETVRWSGIALSLSS